jgi:serine/threonine protein kinase
MPELPYAEELQAMLEGRYIVESFLGQGGMGAVYKGLQLPLKRPVAIKVLAKRVEGVEDDFSFEERFKREAYAMAALTHPNIVQVYDCGDAGESWLFISMELVEGGDLSDALKSGSVTPESALKLITQICDGLQAAHERGIVHRDIKPANIFLTADGRAKVADFGLAKKFDVKGTLVTKAGLGMGTPDYAAPEQYEGVSDLDHRADIYALGVMMYQMITGRLPRGAYKPASQRVAVDPRIDAVLAKAMEQDRAERYQSAADIKADIQSIAAKPQAVQPVANTRTSAVPIGTRPATTGKQPSKPVARQRGATSAVPAAARAHTPAKAQKAKAGPNFILIGSIIAAVLGGVAMIALRRPTAAPAPGPSATSGASSGFSTSSPSGTSKAPASMTQRAPVTTPLAKPGELLTFGGHRYQLISERLPWGTANAKAEAMGGHLAIITSEAENEWMQQNVARPGGDAHVFLGATRTNGTGVWTWVTGAPVDMSLWGGNGPDGSGGELTWLGSHWDDVGGNQSFMSLVEWDDANPKPPPALTSPVDLLASADVKRDAVKGDWQKTPDGLVGSKASGPQIFGFNQLLPEEYDFEIEFTPTGGQREVSQALPVARGSILWKMGVGAGDSAPFLFGPYLDGKNSQLDPQRTEAVVRRPRLNANQRYRSVVEVRKNSWRALIDGEEVLKWNGDLSRIGNEAILTLPNPAHPGVVSFSTPVIFHKVEVRPAPAAPVSTPVVASQPTVPPSAPAPSPAVMPATKQETGWINLIDTADVARDSLMVPWTIENGVLKSPDDPKGPDSPQSHTTFLFPIPNPPLNYDLRYRITRDKPGFTVVMGFLRGSESPCLSIDGGGGFTLRGTPNSHQERQWFPPGEMHEVLIEVRQDHLRVFHDGVVLVEQEGKLPSTQSDGYYFPQNKIPGPFFGVGVCAGHITVHAAGFRPVDVVAQRKAAALAADPHLAQLDAGFQTRLDADVEKFFKAKVTSLNQSYAANGIARARAAAQSKGNAAEVAALDAEKASVEKGAGVPQEDAGDTPASIKTLRSTYRNALAKLTAERDARAGPLYDVYLKALDAYMVELTKVNKIAEAQRAKNFRGDIAELKTRGSTPVAGPPTMAGASASVKLFDGNTLTGWRLQGAQDAFAVEDGCIKAKGPRATLMFQGLPGISPIMKDFELSMKVKTESRANSGVFVHCPRNKDNVSFSNALEIQIANENSDPQKTGSVWSVSPVDKLYVHDGEWFDFRIQVRGMTVTTFINGEEIIKWTQPDDWKPTKPGAQLSEGTIGLQSNGGPVWFKDVELSVP